MIPVAARLRQPPIHGVALHRQPPTHVPARLRRRGDPSDPSVPD
jgi:hypothetical protein